MPQSTIMSKIITQRELRNESAAVLRKVQAGRSIIVTRNEVPVAELRPIQPRRFVPRAVIAEAAARAPRIDGNRFRADLDAVIDQHCSLISSGCPIESLLPNAVRMPVPGLKNISGKVSPVYPAVAPE